MNPLAQRPARIVLAGIVGLFYFCSVIQLDIIPTTGELDASWSAVLYWALAVGAQWGDQIAFTYGPLGSLHPLSTNYPDLFWLYLAGQILLVGASAWLFAAAAYRLPPPWAVLWLVLLAWWLPWVPGEASWLLIMPLAIPSLVGMDGAGRIRCAAAGLLITVTALIKFNSIPLFGATLAAAALLAWHADRRGRALALLFIFPSCFIAGWLLCGQSLAGLSRFFLAGMALSGGYSAAMQISPSLGVDLTGLALLAGLGLFLLALAWREKREERWPVMAVFGMLLTFLAWKSFYTRADGHIVYFLAIVSLLPLVLLSVRATGTWLHAPAFALAVAAAVGGVLYPQGPGLHFVATIPDRIERNLRNLSAPRAMLAARQLDWQQESERNALPRVRAKIRQESIDLLGNEQRVLLLNSLNYDPRPVIQSYAAYTPALARINEAHFLKRDAPQHVLVRIQGLDLRLPSQDDGLALTAILRGYRPVLSERGFVLASRDATVTPAPLALPAVDDYHTALLGEAISVPDSGAETLLAFVDVSRSRFGKALSFVLREPVLQVELQLDDGSVTRHRLLRSTASEGFVLSPALADAADWTRLYLGEPLPKVRTIKIVPTTKVAQRAFEPEFRYAFRAMPVLHSDKASTPLDLVDSMYPGFSRAPASRDGAIAYADETGLPVLAVHSPARLEFVRSDDVELDGEFGVREAALTAAGCEVADGILLRVSTQGTTPSIILWQRHIDPFHVAADRGPQHFSIDLRSVAPTERIVVEVMPGTNSACDWGFLRNLRFLSDNPRSSSTP